MSQTSAEESTNAQPGQKSEPPKRVARMRASELDSRSIPVTQADPLKMPPLHVTPEREKTVILHEGPLSKDYAEALSFFERYKAGLPIEAAAIEHFR